MKQLITLTALLLTIISSFSQTQEQDSLTIQLAYQKQDSSKVDTSIQLIKSYYTTNDLKKALQHIGLSEKLSTSLKYYKGTAEIKYYKALVYSKKDDYFNAYDNFNKSLQLFAFIKDSLGIAKVNNGIGLIEIKRGNFNRGLIYSLSAIDIFERRNLKYELGLAYNNLSEAYFNTKQFVKALDFNIKALQVREQLQDSVGIISSTKSIAQLYSMRKEHRKAIEYYEKTLRYLDPEKDKEIRGEVLPTIGAEYLKFNDIKNATTYLLQGLRLNKSINNKNGLLKTYNSLANLNLKLKKDKLAESQLDKAFALTSQVENDSELLENYRLRISFDSIYRNYRKAFNLQNKYYALKDKIEKENAIPIVREDPLEDDFAISNIVIPQDIVNENSSVKKLKFVNYTLIVLLIILSAVLIGILLHKKSKKDNFSRLKEKVKSFNNDYQVLLKKNKELEETNQVKDRLFSIVSHDLKDSSLL